MKLYRFSPIETKAQFEAALEYIAKELPRLSEALCGVKLPVDTLRVFTHYPGEYERLCEWVRACGPDDEAMSSNTGVYVKCNLEIDGERVKRLGVRKMDPYRFQVGCGDYTVAHPADFYDQYHKTDSDFIRGLPGREDKFIELWHPNFDVAGYISKQ